VFKQLRRLLSNWYVFSIVSKISLVLIGLLYSALTARYLGTELKGETAYISSVVSTIGIFTSFGLHQAYPYYRKTYGKEKIVSKYMSNIVVLHVIYLLICVVTALFVGSIENCVITLFVPFASYYRITSYVATIEKPNRIQLIGVIAEIVEILIILVLLITIPANYGIAVAILVAKEIILSIIFSMTISHEISFKNIDVHLLIDMGKYGFFPMVALLLSTMNYRVDTIMMKHMDCISTSQLGVYSIGIMFANKVLLIPEAVKTILLAKLSRDKGAEEVAMATRLCLPIAIFTCIGIVALGKPFIRFLYGGDFAGAYEVTVATMVGIIAIMYYKMIATYNNVNRMQKINIALLSIAVITNILLNFILLPKLNIVGGALASTFSYTLCAVLFIGYFKKKTAVKLKDMFIITRNDVNSIINIFKR
jgi:O-antigen/teichoic acid export membrane protein